MAFQTASGYGNLPNGNFSSVIYSKKVQLAFRKSTVVGDITNSDFFGEISAQGDTVKIIKEPEISVNAYARGTQVSAQDLDDEDFSLVVDKANYYAFKIDDIEEAHSHSNFMQLATDRAAYRLADQHDQEVLGYLSGYKQSALHSKAGAVNDVVNGTKAVSTAGSDELLTSMKLTKRFIWQHHNDFCCRSFDPSSSTSTWCNSTTNSNSFPCDDYLTHETFDGSTAS